MAKSNKDSATTEAKRILSKHLDEAIGGNGSIDDLLGDPNAPLDPNAAPTAPAAPAPAGLGSIGGDSSAGVGDLDLGIPPVEDGGIEVPGQEEKPLAPQDDDLLKGIGAELDKGNNVVITPKDPNSLQEKLSTDLHYVPDGHIGAGDPRNEEWYNIMSDIIEKLKCEKEESEKKNKKFLDKSDNLEQEVTEVKKKLDEMERKYIETLKQVKVVLAESAVNMAKSNYVWQVLGNQNLSEGKRRQAIKDITECQTLNEAKAYFKSVENLSTGSVVGASRNHFNSGSQEKLQQFVKDSASIQDNQVGGRSVKIDNNGGRVLGESLSPEQKRMQQIAGIRE